MAVRDGTWRGARKAARGTRFARLADVAEPALRAAAVRRGMAEHRLIETWPGVVGDETAGFCRPVRITTNRGQGLGGTLIVAVHGPRVPEIRHMADQIIERVNAVYGHRAVSRLRVETEAMSAMPAPLGLQESSAGYVDDHPELTGRPSETVAAIADDGLRDALARLETNIRRRRTSGTTQDKP